MNELHDGVAMKRLFNAQRFEYEHVERTWHQLTVGLRRYSHKQVRGSCAQNPRLSRILLLKAFNCEDS